ncbi:MAG: hypothetical protein B7Z47_04580 [Chthoniobacter sp. 12-60-6]|nr:MAG: hypothetical protein B7Z47_04580 [Chthoniobacter sp. 12-60-6]
MKKSLHCLLKSSFFNLCQTAFLLVLASCSTIAMYDKEAYKNATELKVDARNLMELASQPYSAHEKEAKDFQSKLDKAYEYDNGRIKNTITVKQWDILRDPKRDLLGGFLAEWKEEGALRPRYIQNKQVQIGRAFDTIIQLESGKLKPADVQ